MHVCVHMRVPACVCVLSRSRTIAVQGCALYRAVPFHLINWVFQCRAGRVSLLMGVVLCCMFSWEGQVVCASVVSPPVQPDPSHDHQAEPRVLCTQHVSWWVMYLLSLFPSGYSLSLFPGECHNHTACFLVSSVLSKLVSWWILTEIVSWWVLYLLSLFPGGYCTY